MDTNGDIQVDEDGNPVYALDSGNNKIVATDDDGNVIYRDYYTHDATEIANKTATVKVGRFNEEVNLIPVIAYTYTVDDTTKTVYMPEGTSTITVDGTDYTLSAVSPTETDHRVIARAKDWGIDTITGASSYERTDAKADRFVEIRRALTVSEQDVRLPRSVEVREIILQHPARHGAVKISVAQKERPPSMYTV